MAGVDLREMISLVYEGTDDPAAFTELAPKLTRALSGSIADLELRNRTTLQHEGTLARMIPSAAADGYYAHWVHRDILAPEVIKHPPGSIVESDLLVPRRVLERTDFYHEWMRPHEMERFVACVVPITNEIILAAAVQRGDGRSFSRTHLAVFGSIMGHLERAIRLSLPASHRERTASARATFVLDGEGHIVRMNQAGRELLDAEAAVTMEDGRFRVHGLIDVSAVDDVLAATRSGVPAGRSTLAVRGAFRSVVQAWTDGSCDGFASVFPQRAYVRVAPVGRLAADAEKWIGRALRLSPAEARIAVRLARGETLDDIADAVGVSPATVRTQLKNIFLKSGTRRQAELAAVVARLLEPLPNERE